MREISFDGLKISRLGLGTVQFGQDYGYTKKLSQRQVDSILEGCAGAGIRFLDTARVYGDSEKKIGNFFKRHPRAGWVVATKLGRIPKGACANSKQLKKAIVGSIQTSMKALGVDMIDMLQLHDTSEEVLKNKKLWDTMREIGIKNKMFSLFGVSFYDLQTARSVLQEHHDLIRFIQAPYNVFDQRFAGMFSWLSKKKIAFISRSTFLKGVLGASESNIPVELKPLCRFRKKLCSLAQGAGLTMSECALLFAFQTKGVASSLIGVKSREELELNLRALERMEAFKRIEKELMCLERPDPCLTDPRTWKQL